MDLSMKKQNETKKAQKRRKEEKGGKVWNIT